MRESLASPQCCAVTVVSSVIVVSAVTPPVLLAIFALALIYRQIQKRYVATSRELKRYACNGPPFDSCFLDTEFIAHACVARLCMPPNSLSVTAF